MSKQRQVVRVVIFDSEDEDGDVGTFIEQLRYAGLARVYKDGRSGDDGLGPFRIVFDLIPTKGVLDDVWARQNSERMQSFGYNAVVAPEVM